MATVLGPLSFESFWPPGGGVEGLVDEVALGGLEVEAGEVELRQLVSSEAPTSFMSEEPPERGLFSYRPLLQWDDGTNRCGLGSPP